MNDSAVWALSGSCDRIVDKTPFLRFGLLSMFNNAEQGVSLKKQNHKAPYV